MALKGIHSHMAASGRVNLTSPLSMSTSKKMHGRAGSKKHVEALTGNYSKKKRKKSRRKGSRKGLVPSASTRLFEMSSMAGGELEGS